MKTPAVGDVLPEEHIELTASRIVATALASRDFEPVHHDRDAAQAAGMPDVFLNILSTNGFVIRYVTDWAGPRAVVQRAKVRLGVPSCAGDVLVLSGEVAAVEPGENGTVVEVAVTGRNGRGEHARGTVAIGLAP